MSTAPSAPAAPARPGGAGFRPELHGLRGLAILLVVLYHVWADRVSGGVDVFLFLSSFLLVGSFARRAEEGAALRPLAYWGRTFKRLLPPTAVVVLATLAGVRLVLPADRWMPAITDALGSILHVENWVLIRRGVDYYASDDSLTTPFQHFWSLSMQGQVFLLWPVLIAVTVWIARRVHRAPRRALVLVLTLVLVVSLAWSIWSTATQQTVAYFDTRARLWEFAAGSLLGLLLPGIEARRGDGRRRGGRHASRRAGALTGPRVAAGWLGLVGLVSCGLLVDVQGAFPGWIAAWPLAAAALVLWAGTTGHALGADRLLASAPMRWIGDVSYGLYLVHWPLLALYLGRTGHERAGVLDGAVIVAASLLGAWLLTRLVDTPFRRWPWASARAWRSGLVVACTLVLALAPVLAARHHLVAAEQEALARAVADNPGARTLSPDYTPDPDADPSAPLLPTPAMIGADWVSGPEPCQGDLAPEGDERGELDEICRVQPGADEDSPVLVSVGNSRLEQFSGGLLEAAQEKGWTVVALWKGGCTYTPDADSTASCDAFDAAARSYLQRLAPDAVALQTTFMDGEQRETPMPGLEDTLADLSAGGSQILAVRDIPRLATDPTACALESSWDDPGCAEDVPADLLQERPDAGALAAASGEGADAPGIVPLDVTAAVCPEEQCSPSVGNVVVFIDPSHITGTYARSLHEEIDRQLEQEGFTW